MPLLPFSLHGFALPLLALRCYISGGINHVCDVMYNGKCDCTFSTVLTYDVDFILME